MSRQPTSQRNLTLTEELEKLEQSITLTLQEIDSNFSKAHRIVTTSILPIVEQYARHSGEVWEGSKFWKQFFEASANVSLSGYEEDANEDVTNTETTSTNLDTPTEHEEYMHTGAQQPPQQDAGEDEEDEEFTVDSPTQVTGAQSTPKLPSTAKKNPTNTNTRAAASTKSAFKSPSPRKYTGKNHRATAPPSSEDPSTPRAQKASSAQAQSSPFEPESAFQPPSQLPPRTNTNNDPLLHRVLDKNYRVQATPHTQRRQQSAAAAAAKPTPATATKRVPWDDDSPQSSPAIAAPQLRSDLFSPAKYTAARTPGVSVLTPARNKSGAAVPTTSTGRQLFSPQDKAYSGAQGIFSPSGTAGDWDEEDEEEDSLGLGLSPPKTIQFHVPASRLLQTPAREASRKIVEDLLLTAGAEGTEEIEGIDDESLVDEPSPSVVRKAWEEETF